MTDPNLIDLHALRVFLAAVQDRNMSSAAVRLGITQSAVSQTVRALENQLGCVLVNRGDRPLSLTPAGLMLAEKGGVLLDAALDARQAVVQCAQGVNPHLRLGLVDSFAATCGAQLAREMIGKATRLSIRTGLSPVLGQGLIDREFDLIVSTDGLEDSDGVSRHPLLTEGFVLIVPTGAESRVGTVEDLRRLAEALPMIRFNQQSHLGLQVERVIRRHGIKSARRLEVDTSDTLTSMVAAGLGWALTTPLCLLQAEHFGGAVDVSIVDSLVGSRSIYLLAREDQHPQVVEATFAIAASILAKEILPRLSAIDPCLLASMQLHDLAS